MYIHANSGSWLDIWIPKRMKLRYRLLVVDRCFGGQGAVGYCGIALEVGTRLKTGPRQPRYVPRAIDHRRISFFSLLRAFGQATSSPEAQQTAHLVVPKSV